MEITTQTTIIRSYNVEDTLITEVRYDYTGDLEDSVTVEIYHHRPETQEDVNMGISNRGESEKARLLSLKRIEQILNNLNGPN
jgi:hypothetical protein